MTVDEKLFSVRITLQTEDGVLFLPDPENVKISAQAELKNINMKGKIFHKPINLSDFFNPLCVNIEAGCLEMRPKDVDNEEGEG